MTVTPARAGRLLVPERILQLTNLSVHDHQIAWTVHAIGAVIMIAAIIWGAASRCDHL